MAVLLTACWTAPLPTVTTLSETTGPAGTQAPSSPPATLAPDPPIVVTITTTTTTTEPVVEPPTITTTTQARPPPTTTAAPPITLIIPEVPPVISVVSQEFVQLINDERIRRVVPPLDHDAVLAAHALAWSLSMAATGSISHSNIAVLLGPWTIVGENVGAGGSVAGIWAALLNSPLHYANIVDPRFTHLGIGAMLDSDGIFWVTQVFSG